MDIKVEIARYQFHSWARRGLAGNISERDDLGAGTAATLERAEVAVGVSLNEAGLTKQFSLLGPGDITGVNRDMIVRTEPLNWITDFEANYLCFLEFYDEDFAWRYTPAAPVGSRLRPWLFLLVLKEDEFERTKRRLPLSSITVKNNDAFPPVTETWMWAHVHSNADIPESELSDYEKFLQSLNKTTNEDPDQLYCRLMSPRKLEPNTQYCAFLVPSFETGRLAGLEQPTGTSAAQMASWTADGARGEMPFYYEWFFRTGVNADFESLVRILEPRPMPESVGLRDMDCHKPGFVKADGTGELPGTRPELIGLEGALKSPSTKSTGFPNPPAETAFQQELQRVVNLPFEIIGTDVSGDPIISLPLYGGKHAKKSATDVVKLDIDRGTWVHELNKDPRWRVASGFGTTAVQKGQEKYMRKAWAQAKKILEANAQIKRTLFYMKVAVQLTRTTLSTIPQSHLLALARPVMAKVMGSPTTILHQVRASRLPAAVFSGAFRRLVRPRGRLTKRLGVAKKFDYGDLVQRINDGSLTAAPPRETPLGMPNTRDIAQSIFPALPAWIIWLVRQSRLVLFILLLIALLIGLLTGAWLAAGVAVLVVAGLAVAAGRLRTNLQAAESLTNPETLVETIQAVPPQPNFSLRLSDEAAAPPATASAPGADSVEAKNFRLAMIDFSQRLRIKVPEPKIVPLDLGNTYVTMSTALDPQRAFPRRLVGLVKFPPYIPMIEPEKIFEAMAYPDFEESMYQPLLDISGELLLPNLKQVPMNTITLLKTNQKFIESYLVGLNHEMGRELLWREYPTDERGSYFRQFWDVKGLIRPKEGSTAAELAEAAKDIKPIHTWSSNSKLSEHNNRSPTGKGDQTVLLIRGDLLKRYPNTVIFAQKAIPGPNAEEHLIDADLTTEEFASQLRFPLYKAELPPEIKVFGFDLTIEQARGTELTPGFDDHLGWFFVIQEVPGEPRFGMDVSFDPGTDGLSWDDLAWDRLPADTKFIKGQVLPNMNVPDKSRWGADSAEMAHVLFQKPSMIAVHAKEMLETLTDLPS
jgi:hypothetical protein